MALKIKVKSGGYFYLSDGSAILNTEPKTVTLVRFNSDQMKIKEKSNSPNKGEVKDETDSSKLVRQNSKF